MDYSLLDCQAEFCNSKGRGDLALEIAKRSVVSAPSEFGTWARLADIYVSLEQWDLALLTLNSCPMFTYQDKDAPRMPEPSRVFLPILPEAMCDEIEDSNLDDMEMVHPTLRNPRGWLQGNLPQGVHHSYRNHEEDWLGSIVENTITGLRHGGGVPPREAKWPSLTFSQRQHHRTPLTFTSNPCISQPPNQRQWRRKRAIRGKWRICIGRIGCARLTTRAWPHSRCRSR